MQIIKDIYLRNISIQTYDIAYDGSFFNGIKICDGIVNLRYARYHRIVYWDNRSIIEYIPASGCRTFICVGLGIFI